MKPPAFDILKCQLEELGLSFILGNMDTFLHEESNKDRPLIETLSDLFDNEITQRRQRAAKARLKMSGLPVIKTLEEFDTD